MPDLPDAIIQDYEHRIRPSDPSIIEVRKTHDAVPGRKTWTVYMRCDSPQHARRILSLLRPDLLEAQVYP